MKCLRVLTALVLSVAVGIITPCVVIADGAGSGGANAHTKSAEEAIAEALSNVRSRYRERLDRLGLKESYFDETSGICDLMLLDVGSWTKYQIVYYRATGQIEWPRMMPKGVAEDLMQDRLVIHAYEMSLGKGKRQTKAEDKMPTRTKTKSVYRKHHKQKPLHEEVPLTAEEKADMADTFRNARKAAKGREKKGR